MSPEAEASPAGAAHISSAGGYTITVTPDTFTMVDYDAATIAETTATLCQRVGLPVGLAVRVDVDQTTPLGRARIVGTDPVVLSVESGALEDNHRPRQYHEANAALVLGRLLVKLRDRLDPAFGDAPDDDALTLELSAAWDAYATGRLERLGYTVQRQRRLYQFRVRHGFSDDGDAAFAQLWEGENLSWARIEELSTGALLDAKVP
ncbi:MAG TPA: hypothetical protein VGO78_20215 [Acidimicrobiales bacterium]|nr:hypothetical protein [Acidimicrobiales bacterium]